MTDLETKFNDLLRKLNIPLQAVWCPDPNSKRHAEIDRENGLLLIYDVDEDSAIDSFIHEILEYRMTHLTALYRSIINYLLEMIDKWAYRKKDEILEQILCDFKILAKHTLLEKKN